jgi:hypothetical protein
VVVQCPISRADVFQSPLLSPLEKRQLIKLLQTALGASDSAADSGRDDTAERARHRSQLLQEWGTRPFVQWLDSEKVKSETVRRVVMYAVGLFEANPNVNGRIFVLFLFLCSCLFF